MSRIQAPRGTRDFAPAEMAQRRHVEGVMRDVFRRFGYHEVQTPTFEELELFTAKSGPGIVSELYSFKDKGHRDITLRPELTAPVMRFYYTSLAMEPKPVRLFYFGNCFRYDRPQKGRYREFWQMGCELIGPETPEAWAEVLAMGLAQLRAVGVRDVVARVGHLGILHGALMAVGFPPDAPRGELMRAVDKWDAAKVRAELEKAGVPDDRVEWFLALHGQDDLAPLATHLKLAPPGAGREKAEAAHATLVEVRAAAVALGADPGALRVDPLIARGLDYYTGIVFEIDAPALGAEKQLLGGGAYDLSGVFGGEPVASCGFGLGFDRTLVALEAEAAVPAATAPLDVYLAAIGDAPRPHALALTSALRAAGLSTEVDLMRRNPAKNLKAADTRRARFAVLLGAKELEAGAATVKDLSSGVQEAVPMDRVPAWIAARRAA